MAKKALIEATILVIDDEPRWKELLEEAFPHYRFLGALSGGDGVRMLQRPNEIDLVILDYKMKGLDGIDVLKKIRQFEPRLGVIMLTGYGDKEVVVEALEGHADDFIDKPFKLEEMRDKIRKLLEGRADVEKTDGGPDGPVQRVARFVRRNFDKTITLQDVSKIASLSPKYLSRVFKEEIGVSLTQYRLKLRVDKAKEMLTGTSFNINEIAERLGYENAFAFEKLFKKIEGLTPTEYRSRSSKSPSKPSVN